MLFLDLVTHREVCYTCSSDCDHNVRIRVSHDNLLHILTAYCAWYHVGTTLHRKCVCKENQECINFIFFDIYSNIKNNQLLSSHLSSTKIYIGDKMFELIQIKPNIISHCNSDYDLTISRNVYHNICENATLLDLFIMSLMHWHKIFDMIKLDHHKWTKSIYINNVFLKLIINSKRQSMYEVNQKNMHKYCKMLISSINSGLKIHININWFHLEVPNKQYCHLLQDIGHSFILGQDDGLIGFLPDQKCIDDDNRMNNCVLVFGISFMDKRIIYNFMNTELQWQYIFIFFNDLLRSKCIMTRWNIHLIEIFKDTCIWWKCKHVSFLCDIGILESLSIAMRNVYYHKDKRTGGFCKYITFMIKVICALSYKKNVNIGNVISSYDRSMKKLALEIKINDFNRMTIQKHIKSYDPFLDESLRHIRVFSMIRTLHNYKFQRFIMICANHKCNIYQYRNYHKKYKMKLCKQCKLVYYCGKHCQKYHWNHIHRYKCKNLSYKQLL